MDWNDAEGKCDQARCIKTALCGITGIGSVTHSLLCCGETGKSLSQPEGSGIARWWGFRCRWRVRAGYAPDKDPAGAPGAEQHTERNAGGIRAD